MTASFSWAVRYKVTAECCSPLRIGGSENNAEALAIDGKSGRPYIPATSIAGPFKNYANSLDSAVDKGLLLGDKERNLESKVIFGDGLFQDDKYTVGMRPRVRINKATATADDGGKFDILMVEPGSQFKFEIVARGSKKEVEDSRRILLDTLSALNDGMIMLGGQKTNGFGKIRLKRVDEKLYDLHKSNDLRDWMNDDGKYNYIELTGLHTNTDSDAVTFSIKAKLDSVFIKSQFVNEKNNTVNISSYNEPVIPGSSLKGVFRNRCESIADYLGIDTEITDVIFGADAPESVKSENTEDAETSVKLGKPGHAFFDDAVIKSAETRSITRIRINKITGGVMTGALASESVPSGEVEIRIAVRNLGADEEAVACGLLIYTIRDLAIGRFSIGGNTSIGRGRAYISSVEVKDHGKSGRYSFDSDGNMKPDAESRNMTEKWLKVIGGCR